MKIKSYIYIFFACYAATFLRIFINNSLIVSIIGSLFFGFVIAKKLSSLREKIILIGFLSSFTSFSGFMYYLYRVLNEGGWIKFIIFFNFIIMANLLTMYFGFWISRKFT